jgi:tetratricopeptide (TPR) repeat protein
MGLVDKYRWGNISNIPVSNIEIDSLATLESIKRRQGWMIAAQVATVAAIAHQTKQTTDALKLVNDTLISIEEKIQDGFDSLESSIERLEANLLENLNEIKWYLFNVDQKLDQLINLVKFSGATKSAEYNKQGFILYKIGSYNEAIGQLNKSLEENPLNIEAYINLGFIYLRQEKIDDSIFNFERASKIVKEDFSYFEEISQDRLKSTEVFILENLSTLYGIQDKHSQSIEYLNSILSKDIDKKTEVLSKYKLSKYLCLSGNHEEALNIISELINGQYFEPVALAVSNHDFSPISSKILSILQGKLENVKKSFEIDANLEIDKVQIIDIDLKIKSKLIENIKKLISAVNNSSNYSILLTSEFKERHSELLTLLELLSELRYKADKELITLSFDYKKLETINHYNNEIDSNYSNDDDVLTLSHKILLTKIKQNVKKGIDSKVSQFDATKTIHQQISKKVEIQLDEIDSILIDEFVGFIKTNFNFNKIIDSIRSPIIKDFRKEKKKKKQEEKNLNLEQKISKDYFNLFEKYLSKEKISTSNLEQSYIEDYNDFSDVIEIARSSSKLEAVKLLKDKTGWGLKECKDWVDDNT